MAIDPKDRCEKTVMVYIGNWPHPKRCSRKATISERNIADGKTVKVCTVHLDVYRQEKLKKREEEWERNARAERPKYFANTMLELLKRLDAASYITDAELRQDIKNLLGDVLR